MWIGFVWSDRAWRTMQRQQSTASVGKRLIGCTTGMSSGAIASSMGDPPSPSLMALMRSPLCESEWEWDKDRVMGRLGLLGLICALCCDGVVGDGVGSLIDRGRVSALCRAE